MPETSLPRGTSQASAASWGRPSRSQAAAAPGQSPARAVAEAALDGLLNGVSLQALGPDQAIRRVQQVKGLGPFAAELVVLRGANAPDGLPRHEPRLDAEISEQYGPGRTSPKSPRPGCPTAPGPLCTCAPSASSEPARSPGTEPPGPPGYAQWALL